MSEANSIYRWVQPSYSRVIFRLWRVWEKLSGRSLAVKSSVMSRQKLARHLSFVSPHFSTETLSLSYMPELILTTRLLGVRCSCVVRFPFQVPVPIYVGASWDTPEHASRGVRAPLCAHVFRQQDENKPPTTNIVSFFTYSNQSLAMRTSHLQLRCELSFQVRFFANMCLCFT